MHDTDIKVEVIFPLKKNSILGAMSARKKDNLKKREFSSYHLAIFLAARTHDDVYYFGN